jgi:hypothetical protein
MNWLIYIAAAFLFVGYVLIPKKPVIGWAGSTVGNALYIIAFIPLGKVELLIAPVGFTVLSVWNLWKEHKRFSK